MGTENGGNGIDDTGTLVKRNSKRGPGVGETLICVETYCLLDYGDLSIMAIR